MSCLHVYRSTTRVPRAPTGHQVGVGRELNPVLLEEKPVLFTAELSSISPVQGPTSE